MNDHSDSPFLISKAQRFTREERKQQQRDANVGATAGLVAGGYGGYKAVKGAHRVKNAADIGGSYYRLHRLTNQGRLSSAASAAKTTAVAAAKAPKGKPTLGALVGGYVGMATGATAGAAAADTRRKKKQRPELVTKNLTQAQIDRRKRAQGNISLTTATLGLTGLGLLGAGHAAPKLARVTTKTGKLVNARKVEDFSAKAKEGAKTVGIISGGVGGVGGYNFASYTKAEARQRKKNIHQ